MIRTTRRKPRRAEGLAFRVSRRAIAMGGTCSGEHGHRPAQGWCTWKPSHGHGVELMRTIKASLDPHGIMNPGKIYRTVD